MIRAVFKKGARTVLVVGITDENIRRLVADEPIYVDGKLEGLPVEVVIAHYTTRQEFIDRCRSAGLDLPDSVALDGPEPTPEHPYVWRANDSDPKKKKGC